MAGPTGGAGSPDPASLLLRSPYDAGVRPTIALRRPFALVPARGLEAAKARLGEALDAEERRALVERLLVRTMAAALDSAEMAGVVVVSPDDAVRRLATSAGAIPVEQRDGGLNEALDLARATAVAAGADALLVIPADLPAVSPAELSRVLKAARAALAMAAGPAAPRGVIALVTDRSGDGTNLLLLAPPGAIPFSFGPGSRARHAELARAAGVAYVELDGPLALDLDTPDDLLVAEAAGLGSLRVEMP